MTWLGPDVMVRGCTPDGHILFVTTYGQPFFRNYRAYTLDPAGGMPQLLPLGQVNHLAFGPGKAMVIGRNTADPARWKRYRGGTAGHLWIDADGSGHVPPHDGARGQHHEPDVDRRAHLLPLRRRRRRQSLLVPARRPDLRRHTDHDDFYARHAQTDGKRIVYQCGADIWLFDPASGRRAQGRRSTCPRIARRRRASSCRGRAPRRLRRASGGPQRRARRARQARSRSALWEGAVRQHGAADGARYRHGAVARRRHDARRGQRRDRARSACVVEATARRARCRGTSAA